MVLRTNHLITVDPVVWEAFQQAYPRQASKFCEDTMRNALAIKSEFEDRQLEELRNELEQKKDTVQELSQSMARLQTQISNIEMTNRQKFLKEQAELREEREQAERSADAVKAAGVAEKIGEGLL